MGVGGAGLARPGVTHKDYPRQYTDNMRNNTDPSQ